MTITVSLRIANGISLENAFILQMIGILLNKYVVLFKEMLITVGVIAMFSMLCYSATCRLRV